LVSELSSTSAIRRVARLALDATHLFWELRGSWTVHPTGGGPSSSADAFGLASPGQRAGIFRDRPVRRCAGLNLAAPRTRDGKLQVELAQLKYLPPRLAQRAEVSLSRLASGIGGRGPGETRLAVDRRRTRDRVARSNAS